MNLLSALSQDEVSVIQLKALRLEWTKAFAAQVGRSLISFKTHVWNLLMTGNSILYTYQACKLTQHSSNSLPDVAPEAHSFLTESFFDPPRRPRGGTQATKAVPVMM